MSENKLFHQSLRRAKGPASQHKCITCGGPAFEWAYQHTDESPLYDEIGSPYSLNFDHYSPMCRSDHRKLDFKMNPEASASRIAKLVGAVGDSEEMRRRGLLASRNKKHESTCSRRLATREGVRRCPCGARRLDMKATILDMWEIDLPETGENKWWLDWALAAPKHAGDHLAVSFRTFESLLNVYSPGDFGSIHEYFGGIGAHALMTEDLFEPPLSHSVCDYAPEAVEHMQRVLPGGMRIWQNDAYGSNGFQHADLQVMDFGDLTVFQAQPGKARGDLLEEVFASEPMAVTVTDIAARYLHLQKRSYEPILGPGACDSYEEYLERYSRHLEERFGYVMLEGHYTRWSCHMAFVPADRAHHGEFHKLPKTATPGLVLS